MTARELISTTIVPLATSDTGKYALQHMVDYHVRHLPIVLDGQLLGLVSEDDILQHDSSLPISAYNFSFTRPAVKDTAHYYDIIHLMSEFQLTLIPVVDAREEYLGTIAQQDLLTAFAKIASLADAGSVVVLETAQHNYSLAEIARIVESENAVILSSYVTSIPESMQIEITIKISKQNIGAIVSAFQRFNYTIKGAFAEDQYQESLQSNYDAFVHYLNV